MGFFPAGAGAGAGARTGTHLVSGTGYQGEIECPASGGQAPILQSGFISQMLFTYRRAAFSLPPFTGGVTILYIMTFATV